MIRALLAEDQAMVRGALAALLALEPDIEIVGEAARGDEALALALATRPDVALLDIEMPGMDGLAVAAALHQRLPACKIIILTTFGRPGYLRRAMESGVAGFLVKDAPAAQLAAAIRRVMAGERVVDPALALSALSAGDNPRPSASGRCWPSRRAARRVAEIAATLVLSEGTVRNYLSSAIQKTGGQNRIEAAQAAERNGWL